jgi:tetratricopeptide (TPR) repeat protein
MKKIIFLITFISVSAMVSAQSMQIQNMINYLRSKEYEKAKAAADAAAVHESTRTSPKMWLTRGRVYHSIYSDTSQKVRSLDAEAEEKALEAYINCLKNDKENIYKDDAKGLLVQACGAVNHKAMFYRQNNRFEDAIKTYDLLANALPYDFDQGIKRNNITKEKLIYNKFDTYRFAGNKEKVKELAGKLIEVSYKDPVIYTEMVKISMIDKDTAAALSYIEKGKNVFEDNMELITSELDIYLARKRTDILKDKLRSAIELAPDNEVLHFVLGKVYQSTDQTDEAEKAYLRALEAKPDYELANYNLAVLYYNAGTDWNAKLNALSLKDPRAKEFETKSNDYFKKAVVYFEASYEVSKDKSTKQKLRQLYLRLGQTEKADKYK